MHQSFIFLFYVLYPEAYAAAVERHTWLILLIVVESDGTNFIRCCHVDESNLPIDPIYNRRVCTLALAIEL